MAKKILKTLVAIILMFLFLFLYNIIESYVLPISNDKTYFFRTSMESGANIISFLFLGILITEKIFKEVHSEGIFLISILIGIVVINMFNYTYFTDTKCIKSKFFIKKEYNYSDIKKVKITAKSHRENTNLVYKMKFNSQKEITIYNPYMGYYSKKLFELNKIIKGYNPKYIFDDFNEFDLKKMDEYSLKIINSNL